jgi:hypothetical protein
MHKFFILLFLPASLFSQILSRDKAEEFIKDLLRSDEKLRSWFDESDLEASHRLGIEYEGVKYKNMIGYDIDEDVKAAVRNGPLSYTVGLDRLEKDYCRLVISFGRANRDKEFYFRGNRCISPLDYFSRNWTVVESRHFRFFVSDTNDLNAYCIKRLESGLDMAALFLGLTGEDKRILQKEKIYYYLCKDEDEIAHLTGFRARGMCNLAYDAVISTFSNHFHELLHLLINFKLRRLPLYTHPFLQEGFAVAYGGRGGMESGVLLNLGEFLWRSQSVDFQSLLSKAEFDRLDASLSYPAAGLFNEFLFETIGAENYLKLYRKHSGSARDSAVQQIAPDELPPMPAWQSYLQKRAQESPIILDSVPENAGLIFENEQAGIFGDSSAYYTFALSDTLLLPGKLILPGYVSRIFREHFPGRAYRSEEYLISANAEEISVYNLFTNSLVANYVASFSIPPRNVPRHGKRYIFGVHRNVFDAGIESLQHKGDE